MRVLGRLQRSQLSVQASTRLCSVSVFLLASRADPGHLALVALQGALLAIPYTLLEALVGRPLSAGVVPHGWNVEAWARRVSAATVVPVGAACYLATSVALPRTGVADRLLMMAPVLLQLPLEALFWATARTRGRPRANLLLQLTAAGTVLGATAFAVTGVRLDVAALPAQVLVLGWVLLSRPSGEDGPVRPSVPQCLRVGAAYCVAAVVDLAYAVAFPSVAGAVAGPSAIVVVRAMDLAFGPFHVALSAATREDIVAGRDSRLRTGTRLLTVALLAATTLAVVASPRVRGLLAPDLAALGAGVVALYCGYKALLMGSTWLAVRHMVRVAPRRFLMSAVGSRVLACGGLAAALWWVTDVAGLFRLLVVVEAAVGCWYAGRIAFTPVNTSPRRPLPSDTLSP